MPSKENKLHSVEQVDKQCATEIRFPFGSDTLEDVTWCSHLGAIRIMPSRELDGRTLHFFTQFLVL